MDDDNEWKNLPVDEKCVHKSWKARLEGYEAAGRLFQSIDDDKSPEWSKYAGLIKKFIADSNLTAQEKGLDAVLAYAENYVHAGKTVGEAMSNLVQKCIGSSSKAKTKELAVQISLMYIEIEKYEVVVEELLKGTESKNPKTSCGCLTILTQALKEFGPKIIPVSKILKKMPIILSDRDKNVRGEGRALIVEIYRWIGAPIKQQLSTLKAAQMTELEAEFEKISGPPPHPTRLLRSQQAKKVIERSIDSGDGVEDVGADEGEGVEEIDPTEFLEPVDILSKLPKNFMAQLEEKKWTERRDALETLEKELQSAPRLEPVDYGDLIRALKKIIAKDSNIVVVVVALKCLTGLATGLKKKFMPYVGMLFSTLLEKFKEKKQNVLSALRDSVDAIFLVAHLESIHEDTIAALDNKNPCIKNEVSLFLARCFTRCTPTILNKKLLKVLSAGLLKVLNDSDPGARDAAASALGTAMKVVGEKGIAPFLADIGDQKMSKIKSCCESATLQAPIKVAEVNKTEKSSTTSKQPSAKAVTRPTSKTVRPLKKDASAVKTAPKDSDLSKKLSNKIPSNILNELNDSDGNKRLQAYEELLKHIHNSEIPKESISAFFEAIGTLEDDNASVVKVKINSMKAIAEKSDLSGTELKSTLVSLLKKYSDSKYADNVAGCFASFSKSLGNDNFAQSILAQNIVADKLLWASSLKWISEGIINYNLTFNEDYLQREAQKAIKSGNLQMKYAGCAFAGTIQMMNKDGDSAPPASDYSSKETSPVKSEIPKKREIKSSDGTASSKASVDISVIINAQCLSELSDESWKARLDCLEKLRPLIENAGPISSNIGEVQSVFENLLTDKNTKVTQSALMCLASLIKALGPHSRKYTGFFLAKVLKNLSDPKVWVRNCVISVLDAFGTSGGYKELFDNDTIADVCTTITLPAARVELFNWICHTLNKVESVPSDGLIAMLPILYQSLEDRNGDIRKSSNETVISCMMHLGYDTMLNASTNLKGSTAIAVKNLLDKNRGSVPEPPVEKTVRGGKSIQMKKLSPGFSATFTKPSKTVKPGPTSRSSAKKDDQENVDGPLLDRNNFKHQRVMDEQKLKTLKWNFPLPRPEFIEQLRDQMNSANVNPGLVMSMFHSDFKFHIKAIDSLTEDLPINREGMICNLDLILRWMTLRFFDTNPSVLIKGLEYLLNIFNALIEENYSMLDIEAYSFLPYLLLKAGDTKDTVKNHVRNIFKLTALIYPRQKLFGIMMEGLKSKNARLRSELLELLCWMISTYSLEVCSPNVGNALKEIGKHISDKDTSVRNGALNCMVAVFHIVGEDIHKLIGQLPYGPSTLLEERLKRASKQRPVANIKPHNINQEETMHHIRNRTPDEMNNSAESSNSSENNELNATYSREPSPLPETQYHQSPQHQPVYHQQTHQPKELHIGAILEQKVTGPFRLDPIYYQPLPSIEIPDIKTPDLSFLNSPIRLKSKVFTLPGASKNASSQPTTIGLLSKHEDPVIKEFTNPDLEKAITSMAQIETLLYSHKAETLKRKMDFLASQLEQQLIILNQSTHPDLVNCYRGNFSLILKFSDNESLSQEISEPYLSKLIKQLLLLLTENRLEKIGQEMFVKTVNNVVIRLLETSNKTASVCGLIKMLQSTIRSPTSKDFHDLVTKCLWKLSRTQSVWDHQLNYPLVLSDINNFLVEFPSSYWKAQETDIALRTIKTLLHTMVKIRGARVKEELIKVPGLPRASEMSLYISKVIKHYQLENNQQSNNNINNPSGSKDDNKSMPKSEIKNSANNDPQNEITDILQPFINSNESPDALKRLYDFKKSHPQFDIDVHLLSLPTPAICYIKRGLVNLEIKSNQCENNANMTNDCENNVKITNNSSRRVTEDPELDYLWKRLDYWTQLTKTGN